MSSEHRNKDQDEISIFKDIKYFCPKKIILDLDIRTSIDAIREKIIENKNLAI
jgi:hypothetical protein